jgi:glutamyl-tRNA reductase
VNVLTFGVSHHSASLATLERVTMSSPGRIELVNRLLALSTVSETLIVSTCNRVEIYAVATDPHEVLAHIAQVLGEYAGITCEALLDSAFVHHGDAAVHHLFEVAAGLDSLVVGEEQILGQLRAAYAAATDMGAVGSVLHALVQRALRVGKQVRSETGLTRSGASIVSTALDAVTVALSTPGLDGKHAVVLGAGTMGALAVSHLQRSGVSDIAVINRTPSRARQLARGAGSAAVRAIPSQALVGAVVQADVLVACAATSGALLSRDWVESVVRQRAQVQASLVICDLGLPRNVEPEVASVPGVILVNIHTLQAQGAAAPCEQDVAIARRIIATHLKDHRSRRQAAAAIPTVSALRAHAAAAVEVELTRLDRRLPTMDAVTRAEVVHVIQRITNKLLHSPTITAKHIEVVGESPAERSSTDASASFLTPAC